jgi:hypothetical protein
MAGRIALDLKQFKHVKSDDKSHTLQHRDGHLLTLATKPLSKDTQAQLAALAQAANSSKKPTDKAEAKEDKQMLADGGDIEPAQSAVGQQIQRDQLMQNPDPMRGIDPNAPMVQPPQKVGTGPAADMDPANDAYNDYQSKILKDKMGSIMYEPTAADYLETIAGGQMTAQERRDAAMNAANMAGSIGKVGQQASRMVLSPVAQKGLDREIMQAQKMLISGEKKQAEIAAKVNAAREARAAAKAAMQPKPAPAQPPIAQQVDEIGQMIKPAVPTLKASGFAGGGEVREYAEGTDDVQPAEQAPAPDFQPSGMPMTMGPSGVNPGSENMPAPPPPERLSPQQLMEKEMAANAAKLPPSSEDLAKAAKLEAEAQAAKAEGEAKAAQEKAAAIPAPKKSGTPDMQQSMNSIFPLAQQSIQGMAKSQEAQAIQQQKAYEEQAQAQATAAQDFKNRYQALEQERQAHIEDIKNGHIDPDKYWTGDANGNGSHSRLLAGIGMIIAGFNPTASPNAAMEFLNKQIDRSIDAQKANLSSKQNLLSANLQQFHNLRDAQDMTRIMMNDAVANKINLAAAKAAGPQAQAQAQMAMSQLHKQNYELQMQMMMRSVMTHPADDPMVAAQQVQMLRMNGQNDIANNLESKIVPNVGVAKIPVSADVRGQITAMKVLDDKGRDLLNFIRQNSGTMNPSKRAVVQQKVEEMKNFYNDSIKGGALTEGRLAWYDEQFKKTPTDIIPQLLGNTARLNEMVESNHARYNTLIGQHGLPLAAKPQQAPMYKEGQTGKDSNGNPIVFSNGHWRRR